MRISAVIMAHRAREHLVADLQTRLDRDVAVRWDPHDRPSRHYEWDNGRACWELVDRGADWGLVLQDDAVVCRDLIAGLEQALEHVPAEVIVGLYLGGKYLRTAGVNRADGKPWVVMSALTSGIGILVPTCTIDDMLTWADSNGPRNYDVRIGRYYETVLGWPCYYTWPSLVDHAETASLVGHPGGRHAYRFIGEDASALDIDWGSGMFEAAGRISQKARKR